MPAPAVTVNTLFEGYRERLGLEWLTNKSGAERSIIPEDTNAASVSYIGHLNFIHPHRIQVLGKSELDYLKNLGKNTLSDSLDHLFSRNAIMVIIASGLKPPKELVHAAEKNHTALFTSTLPGNKLISHLNYFLDKLLAEKLAVHGVLMDVAGIGVLLTGESAVGKSELALELITRGHRLIADDVPELTRVSPNTLRGSCPELLRDFLEVRGLGILNIRAMFGDSAIKLTKNLRLIIHLVPTDRLKPAEIDRLQGCRKQRLLLEVEIPEIQLPVAPGRNLAVLIEAAARNHILYYNGYNAAEDFIERQRRKLEQSTP